MTDLQAIIERLKGQKVLVLGDMIADIYLLGSISRISREAPVLVLEQGEERVVPGGAANVVNNAATLGGQVYAAGFIGNDKAGQGLVEKLQMAGVNTEGLLPVENHVTLSKTRVIAGGRTTVSQQIVRIDNASKEPVSSEDEKRLLNYILGILKDMGGVVLSDYGDGTVSPMITEAVIAECKRLDIPTIVDSRYDIHRFVGVDYIKQNDAELSAAVGRKLNTEEAIYAAGRELAEKLSAKGTLVTRGEQGMTLIQSSGEIDNIPVSDHSEVFDVSGAGDTCVSVVILALAGGVSPLKAAILSNIASGIAVRKKGTATVSSAELTAKVAELYGSAGDKFQLASEH